MRSDILFLILSPEAFKRKPLDKYGTDRESGMAYGIIYIMIKMK